jgi:hypothetical protein
LSCVLFLTLASKFVAVDSGRFEQFDQHWERGPVLVNSLGWLRNRKIQRGLWAGLAALIAVQIYYVREMLAALFIFAVLFAFGAVVAFILFLLDRASQRTAEWMEPQAKRAAQAARRGFTHLEEEVPKKLPHRPVGAPAN